MRRAALIVAALVSLLGAPTPAPAAEFGIAPGSLSIRALDRFGEPETRAGAHPDRLLVEFGLTVDGTGTGLRDLVLELPPGVAGSLSAVTPCPRELFDEFTESPSCSPQSQVGEVELMLAGESLQLPVYNLEPAAGELGVFGAALLLKLPFSLSLRPGDFGIDVSQREVIQVLPLSHARIELWGVPADHQGGTPGPRRALLTTPTRCGEPLAFTLRARSWQPGAPWHSAGGEDVAPLGDCGDLPFAPRLELELTEPRADAPTGAAIELVVPQNDDPDEIASSHLRSATVTLPEGMTISPGAAVGLGSCSDAQLASDSTEVATCPTRSRVGTLELVTPLLEEPLTGFLYVGEERPGERFRLFAVARGRGVEAKFAGSLRPDPASGRLIAVLDDLPQLPFERVALRFEGGEGALLDSPLRCGPATATARFEPYSGGVAVSSSATVAIAPAVPGTACPSEGSFAPGFAAGVSPARAGKPATFSLTLRRAEGEASPRRLSVTFPPGLSARLDSVEPCPVALAGQGLCPAAARVGSAVAELGAGSRPASLRGDAFLTGPHRGAPFGMAIRFDAVLGPFSLGTVTIQAALRIDPRSGRVTVETDPLPQLVEGLPVRLRTLGLDIDRRGFIANPTSCVPAAVEATARSNGGALARMSSPFRVRGCGALGFAPRVSVGLTGREQLHGRGHPGLRIAVRPRPRDTNLRGAEITLPRMLAFDAAGLRAICARSDALEGSCPRKAAVGTASARTPMLAEPLSGSVFAVQPPGTGLPDLWVVLRGAGVRLDVRARSAVERRRVVTELVDLPDLPLTGVTMRLTGGERGILSLVRRPCGGGDRWAAASVVLEGQSGAARIERVAVERPGCGGAR